MQEVIYRFLKSRSEIDPNADLLSALMEKDRALDAVLMDTDKLDLQEQILDFSQISYYLVNIQGQPVLLYPNEERENYLKIQNDLRFCNCTIYNGFTYAELDAIKDFLEGAGVDYKVNMDRDMRMSLMVSKSERQKVDKAISMLKKEVSTDVGERYLIVKNQCWANAVSQISKALASESAYIGSDGGQNGIRIDSQGAVIMTAAKTEFIPRNSMNFQTKVINHSLETLNGKTAPIKAFYGKTADYITYGMTRGAKAIQIKDALRIAGFSQIPTIKQLNEAIKDELPEDKKKSLYALLRMRLCREMHIENLDKLKQEEKKAYNLMHKKNTQQFKMEFNISKSSIQVNEKEDMSK